MATLNDLVALNGERLDLAADVRSLHALAKIHENWTRIREKASGFEGVAQFVEALMGEQGASLQEKILDRLGLEGLRADLQRIADKFGKLRERYGNLLERTDAFDEGPKPKDSGLVQWNVVAARDGELAGTTLTFDLGANATLQLEAGDTWPGEEPGVVDPLLRISFGGGFTASGKAKAPFAGGSLGFGADANREAKLEYFFDARRDDGLYATSVASRLGDLPGPLDLRSIWKAFETSDLAGLLVKTDGKSSFSVDVSLAEPLALVQGVNANVGLTFRAHVSREGTFHMRLRKIFDAANQSFTVGMTLERSRVRQHGHELRIGVEVDLSSLTKRLQEIIKAHEKDFKTVLDEYRQFLSPGTYLATKAKVELEELFKSFVKNDDLRTALDAATKRALGLAGPADKNAIQELFIKRVGEAFDGATGAITGLKDDVIGDVQAALERKLGVEPGALQDFGAKLGGLVEKVRADLETAVKQTGKEKLDEIVERLDSAGAKVGKGVAKVDKAFARVRDVIGKYEQALQKLKTAADKAAQENLKLQFERESSETRGTELDADFTFLRLTDACVTVFDYVTKGDYDAVLAVIGGAHPDIVIDKSTTASRFGRLRKKSATSLMLFGINVGASTIFEADAKIVADGSGNLSVMSDAEWSRRVRAIKEEREVTFVDVFKLVAAKATERELTIDLAITQQEEALKRDELHALVQSFESAGLLPDRTTINAEAILDGWLGTGKNEVQADVNFALRLERGHVKPLLRLDARHLDTLPLADQRLIFHVAIRSLIASGDYEESDVIASGRFVDPSTPDDRDAAIDALLDKIDKVKAKAAGPHADNADDKRVLRAKNLHKLGAALVSLVDTMGDVYTAEPGVGGWDVDRYLEHQDALRGLLKVWLNKLGFRLFWIRKEMHPRVVAFVRALIELASAPGVAAPVLTLSMTKRTEPMETVMLGPTADPAD